MKYLKTYENYKFNLDLDKDYNDLEEFTKNYLINLIDDGYSIESTGSVINRPDGTVVEGIKITLSKYEPRVNRLGIYHKFKLQDIYDEYIPYVEILNEHYIIEDFTIEVHTKTLSYDDIINCNYNKKMESISVCLIGKR